MSIRLMGRQIPTVRIIFINLLLTSIKEFDPGSDASPVLGIPFQSNLQVMLSVGLFIIQCILVHSVRIIDVVNYYIQVAIIIQIAIRGSVGKRRFSETPFF